MIEAWRIVSTRHAATAFDGEGARLHGGRWNSPGVAVVYVAESRSLATLEVLVGLGDSAHLSGFSICGVGIPEDLITKLDRATLPVGWRAYPAPLALARFGDEWVSSRRSAVLRVPSVVVDEEFNFLLNPSHPDFALLRIGAPVPFRFDERLIRRS